MGILQIASFVRQLFARYRYTSLRTPIWLLALTFLLVRPGVWAAIDPDLLAGMKARAIGPAGMSGRIGAIDAVESAPNTIYVGAATGGVWKSVDGGLTWKPIFDDQPVAAIGALSIFQPNPDIVWVGTGEANPRNSASVGNGLYKSIDAGKTWTYLGLDGTERIHRILLHPSNPELAYVAALGPAWGDSETRGVYKTTDGGKTWQKILYVNERTGAADLAMDPSNPNKLFAAMWEYRRWPWFFKSGGPGSGLHVTHDGGTSWKRLTQEDGLPEGELGRIGVAFSRSEPNIVYAIVEAKKNALCRSEDGGKTWRIVNTETSISPRPFYYADLRIDPERPNRVYRLASIATVSEDGGKTFEPMIPWSALHPDHHAMWINPSNPKHIIDGNDGGVGISLDRGKTWRFIANLPLAQFYHIAVDNDRPYHVYGGMQDNGSWRGPSSVLENGGIRNHHWEEVGFGDGFDTIPDPVDSMRGYAMSQQGYLIRWNLRTGERKSIRPSPPDHDSTLRFNWNAGFAVDPFDPATIYYGSQFVHKSTNRGDDWTIISDDLTTNNPEWQNQAESGGLTPDVTGAENFTSILVIAPSPLERGLMWVGTDDGRVHITQDGGANWTSIERGARGVPPNTWVPHIAPSPHDASAAYIVFDDHRRSNWETYAYRVENHGKRWRRLATDDVDGYALSIVQDPVDSNLLFLGVEFGLYFSLDGGGSWQKWTQGVPTVAAKDLVLHPRDHDLIVGTHGRSAFIIDDISPLRYLNDELLKKRLHLFSLNEAQQYRVKQTGASRFPGHGEYRGDNKPYGALITWAMSGDDLPHPDEEKDRERRIRRRDEKKDNGSEEGAEKEEKDPEVTIEIRDAEGDLVRTFKAPAEQGVNRTYWDLRRDPFREPPQEDEDDEPSGPETPPGEYEVTLTFEGREASGRVRVLPDPRFDISQADRLANWTMVLRAGTVQDAAVEAITRIHQTRADVGNIKSKVELGIKRQHGFRDAFSVKELCEDTEDDPHCLLLKQAKNVKKGLKELEELFWEPPDTKGYIAPTAVLEKLSIARWLIGSSWEAPTIAQMDYLEDAEAALGEATEEFNRFFSDNLVNFRAQVEALELGLFVNSLPLAGGEN